MECFSWGCSALKLDRPPESKCAGGGVRSDIGLQVIYPLKQMVKAKVTLFATVPRAYWSKWTAGMGRIRIGISGWRYSPWRGVFYPRDLAQRRELEFATRAFPTIEINGSFYSLQHPQSYERWYRETPPGFVFSVKGSRYITHMRRLRDIEAPLANFFASGIFNLREKLGPILW